MPRLTDITPTPELSELYGVRRLNLQKIATHVGGTTALARLLDLGYAQISRWTAEPDALGALDLAEHYARWIEAQLNFRSGTLDKPLTFRFLIKRFPLTS